MTRGQILLSMLSERSALDHVDHEAAVRVLLVHVHHVAAGLTVGLDHIVERAESGAVATQRKPGGVDRFHNVFHPNFSNRIFQSCDNSLGCASLNASSI